VKTKHAAIYYLPDGSSCLAWIENRGFHKEKLANHCRTIHELAEAAYPHFISHLWILPAYGVFDPVSNNENWNVSMHQPKQGKGAMSASIFKKGHQQKDLEIIFVQNTSWWGTESAPGWPRSCDAQEVLIVLHYLETALGITVTASPARTGWNYLKKLHPEWIEEMPVDLRAMHFDNRAAADIIWQRPLLKEERAYITEMDKAHPPRKGFVIKVDKGGAYPYASSTTGMGVGVPVHEDHGESAAAMGDTQSIGVWRCTIHYTSSDPSMPPAWKENIRRSKAQDEWIAGPIIRLLRKNNHEVTAHEGFVFPERHNLMVKWATDLWKIRTGFTVAGKWPNEKCAKLAHQATKTISNTTIGGTAFRGFEDDDDMKRPDIRAQVIGRHRELTWHNIAMVHRRYGVTPCIVYMDALYYILPTCDVRAFMPELMKREGELGGYKYEGYIELTPNVLAIFDSAMSESMKLEQLNKIGWRA
jgi:hypothetical protein